MGFLSKLIGGASAEPIPAVGGIIKSIFGDKGEKLSHEEIMSRLAQAPNTTHQELMKLDAVSRRGFQANWRPFIGWVCGVALTIQYVGNPIYTWITEIPGPQLGMGTLMPLVMALLGMGGLRSLEKMKGKAK